ncbi:hypothetical protein OUZ56_020501 [Daphnia magna]|uniref:Uncharacterized protein n=1 Tax=Daphnia magna TaxID=35525 RepID=A0ABQ9ZEN1_9CRUS|nr:hypothetical protein OUZ56_020501 [Daphnia magna]
MLKLTFLIRREIMWEVTLKEKDDVGLGNTRRCLHDEAPKKSTERPVLVWDENVLELLNVTHDQRLQYVMDKLVNERRHFGRKALYN